MVRTHDSKPPVLAGAISSKDLPHREAMGRRERKAAATRLRLFRCALQLFAERGLPNVTVEDITEAADVGKGTFFNYFESKDHVLGVMAEIQLGKVHEALEQAEAGKDSVRCVLRHLAERIAEKPGRSPDLARAFLSSFLVSEVIRKYTGRAMREGRQMLAEIVVIGQKHGEIDPKLRKEQVALVFQESLLGTVLLWSLGSEFSLQTSVESTFQVFWRSICVR
jgi:AcrR family transcriptional regulator